MKEAYTVEAPMLKTKPLTVVVVCVASGFGGMSCVYLWNIIIFSVVLRLLLLLLLWSTYYVLILKALWSAVVECTVDVCSSDMMSLSEIK